MRAKKKTLPARLWRPSSCPLKRRGSAGIVWVHKTSKETPSFPYATAKVPASISTSTVCSNGWRWSCPSSKIAARKARCSTSRNSTAKFARRPTPTMFWSTEFSTTCCPSWKTITLSLGLGIWVSQISTRKTSFMWKCPINRTWTSVGWTATIW